MAARPKKSTKRSAASSRQPDFTLFLDRSLGKFTVAECLRSAGATVKIHDDLFPQSSPDDEWLTKVGEMGWIGLTKDRRIRFRRNEITAAKAANARVFVLTAGNLTGREIGAAFIAALPSIYRLATRETPPFVARVTKNGRVDLYEND